MPTQLPRRILIYGVTGTGKSTLARKLSDVTKIQWHDVDNITWEPGWIQKPTEVERQIFAEIAASDEWILDTAYGQWIDVVLPQAELIVALDYPRWVSLQRLARRTLARLFDKRPICGGNRESLKLMFSRDSIILWHFTSFKKKRARIRQWEQERGTKQVVVLRSPRAAERWLAEL